jgi:NAD(P)-dependent dehydrogenase (short-subunit alcohol dehydrogenase family)
MGAACVRRLSAEGVRCAIGYVSNDEAARHTAARAAELGPEPALVKGDVATEAPAMVEEANAALDGVDSIVVTAYPHIIGRALQVTHDEYRRAFDIHYWGTLDLVRAASPSLEAARGSIVVVSSIGTFRYARYYGVLGPAKAAMESLVVYLAAELGPRGIRANAVQPQLVMSDDDDAGEDERTADIAGYDEVLAAVRKRTPLRELARSSDIANTCVSLLSSDFRYVTGQIISADGGYGLLS